MSLKSLNSPPFLSKGDKVAVVSLASRLDKKRYRQGKKILTESFGLEVIEGQHLFAKHHNFAGNDHDRLADFQSFLDNPEIKAIIAGRGGYGTSRIIDQVDWTQFKTNPKWIIGFSDITAVHQQLQKMDMQSIHGPMVVTLTNEEESTESLKKALFGYSLSYSAARHRFNRFGEARGEIIGGNLCLLAHMLGSDSDLSFDDKILFIEDIGEYYYNIDRMMVQLKRAGKLRKLAGLVVGEFSGSKENSIPFGKTAYEIVREHTSEYLYPVCYDFPIGHETQNRAVRCGELMQLVVNNKGVTLNSI